MQTKPCNSCGSTQFRFLFAKTSSQGEEFLLQKCRRCGLVQVNPQPSPAEVQKYYNDSYFTQRTDRGYDNYYSETLQKEISRVFHLNLRDAGFFAWEESRSGKELSSLDIGCAAGYFVHFLKNRGYKASGIEIAEGPSRYAREVLQLEVLSRDFLDWDKKTEVKFDFISLWATIEHLHEPKATLQKIFQHLLPGGAVVLSTCRYGLLAKLQGKNWRYCNVPEHLFYYSMSGLQEQLEEIGFQKIQKFSYGSGMTYRKGAGFGFRLQKKVLDWLVKATNQGDMMVFFATKP